VEHLVELERGAPIKVRPGDGYAPLGHLLVETGDITEETLERALLTHAPLGEVLVLAGHLAPEALDSALETQFVLRTIRLFALPAETRFRFHEGRSELDGWGSPVPKDALELLCAGLRAHGDAERVLEATLAHAADLVPRVHERAVLDRFGFRDEERDALSALAENTATLRELLAASPVPAPTFARVAYVLLITRQLDLGGGSQLRPVGADEPATRQLVELARLQLRSERHRLGAAAPDLPGNGERAPVLSSSRRRRPPEPSEPTGPEPERVEVEVEVNLDALPSSVRGPTSTRSQDEAQGERA
jgi:hypothetical protein